MPSYITGQDRKIDITLRALGAIVSARWVATGNTEIMVEILDKVALPLEKEGVLHSQERSPWWPNATFSSHQGFLSHATRENVTEYVRVRARRSLQDPSLLLIDAAYSRPDPSVNMFQLLLNLDADINFELLSQGANTGSETRCTVWPEILVAFVSRQFSTMETMNVEKICKVWIPVLRLWLEMGAPVEGQVRDSLQSRCALLFSTHYSMERLFVGLRLLQAGNEEDAFKLLCRELQSMQEAFRQTSRQREKKVDNT